MDDFLTDSSGDLLKQNGDSVRGDADAIALERLLKLSPGALKHAPLTGCGIVRLTHARISKQVVTRDISIQLQADKWQVKEVSMSGEEVYVNASRR
jgi:hypothetical protein